MANQKSARNILNIEVDQREDRTAYMREYFKKNAENHSKAVRVYRQRNPEKNFYIFAKSRAKKFIEETAKKDDLLKIKSLLEGKA
ncbi:TPA: hypothetical protein ACGWER_001725 [Streptococcus agalactiae]|nr:hypothetical protein [Streptococcus agalactiae]HEO2267374.1 hypothetical protein [Streptococcus agalactiae]HEO7770452.1 hypothetical protein [Streptococcus agalactiae]